MYSSTSSILVFISMVSQIRPQALFEDFWFLTVSPTPITRKAKNTGYIEKKDVCTAFRDKPNAKKIWSRPVMIIPIVPSMKKEWKFFI